MILKPASVMLVACSLAAIPSYVLGADFIEVDRLIAPDFQLGGASGISAAVKGDTAVICANRHIGAGLFQSGRCLVYRSIGGAWTAIQALEPSFPVFGGRFGDSVAIDGDLIVVGAGAGCCPGATDAGRAFVFRRSGDTWFEEAMLLPVDGADDDFFGTSVAVIGDVVAVGASGDDAVHTRAGAVYVFRRDGTDWPLEQKLLAETGSVDAMGADVAFAAVDDLLVGSSMGVRLYHRSGGHWDQEQLIDPPTTDFGIAIATDGTRLVVGAATDDATGVDSGSLYVYERQSTGWVFLQKLTALDAAGRLGGSIAIQGSAIISGADLHDAPSGVDAGAVYVFRPTGTGWVQSQKLAGSATVAGDRFGRSVALDAGTLFVGASEADEAGVVNVGEAYVFELTGANQPPLADAGPDATVECDGPGGSLVTLDGSGSTDPDSTAGTNDDIVTFGWFEGGSFLGTGEVLQVLLPFGAHVIELRVTDSFGATDSDETVRTVVDFSSATLTVSLDPAMLWPPNHRLVDVTAVIEVNGVCSASTITLESLTGDEPDDAPGGADGNTTADIQGAQTGTDDRAFALRAERLASGSGRTYTATYRLARGSGESLIATATAFVPRSKGGATDPIELTLTETNGGTRLDWTEVAGHPVYNVIRGRLDEIVESDSAYSLGNVACIEGGSADTTTAGWEDAAIPFPGEVFIYLVEYVDGIGVSYGAESADKPRTAAAGECP